MAYVFYNPQIKRMGAITLTSNFTLDRGYFLIKNDGDEAVTLTVKLVNGDEFVTTKFEPGWNPELVKEVQAASGVSDLFWGY